MTIYRIRAEHDSPGSGSYEWAALDDNGTLLDSGSAPLRTPPAGGACELLLACDLVTLDAIKVSPAQRRGLDSSLRFLVEDGAIPDPEKLHVAAARAGDEVLRVGVVDRQWMEQMLGRLERSGLRPRGAYPECLLPELPPRSWVVVWNGSRSFARTGALEGFALDIPGDGDAPVALRLAIEAARAEGTAPERIVLRSGGETEAPALERWSASLGVPLEPGPDWHWSNCPHRPGLNLLQAEFARRGADSGWARSFRLSALLACALAILALAAPVLDWARMVRERNRLTAQMTELYRDAFGEGAVVVDAPLQMRRGLRELRHQAGEPGFDDFLVLLAPVSGHLPDPATLRVESIAYGDGALTLAVRPIDAGRFGALLGELRSKPSPRGLDVKVEPGTAAGTISVRATAGPRGER